MHCRQLLAVKTILVIEDERTIRLNIIKILEFKGYQVLSAADGKAGIDLARQYLPDLVLCDIMMPEMDGYGVLAEIRRDQEIGNTPFIFLTAKADIADLREGMNLGADDYVPKPFTSDGLVKAIEVRLTKQDNLTAPYVEQMREAANSLSQAAHRDLLTDLPNRIGLHQELQRRIKARSPLLLICINIDDFGNINATWGYSTGDLLLQTIAMRLQLCLGEGATISRFNADQFVVILNREPADRQTPPTDQPTMEADRPQAVQAPAKLSPTKPSQTKPSQTDQSADPSAEQYGDVLFAIRRIQAALGPSYMLNDHEFNLEISMGLSLYPDHTQQAQSLITYAETALRWSRQTQKGGYRFYDPAMEMNDRQIQQLTIDLKAETYTTEFRLIYQPQVNLITNRVIGLEAFLRWEHPEFGLLSPHKFMALARGSELVESMTEWTLRTACTQAQTFQQLNLVPISMAVNLSALQFRRPNLIAIVRQVLADTKLDPQLLVLELTENTLMGNQDTALDILHGLKSLGLKIAIDDFGMGYSSLKYFGKFPIDALKIDHFFIHQLTSNEHYAAIVSSIIAMAQTLKLKVIAEGVETDEQIAILRRYGCHVIQGYWHSQPLPAKGIEQLLQQ
jgi:diguanylate cyclase